jgi:hypothetical protein
MIQDRNSSKNKRPAKRPPNEKKRRGKNLISSSYPPGKRGEAADAQTLQQESSIMDIPSRDTDQV